MKVIIGLGNPGGEYAKTRHSVGWLFLDYLMGKYGNGSSGFVMEKKLHAETAEISVQGAKLLLIKPQTFMNESGLAVKKVADWHDVDAASDILVAHDDLDISLGQYKLQKAKGPKVHNGILSIEQHLSSVDFYRLRIGIENRNPENRIDGKTYVLQVFTLPEKEILHEVFEKMAEEVMSLAKADPAKANTQK